MYSTLGWAHMCCLRERLDKRFVGACIVMRSESIRQDERYVTRLVLRLQAALVSTSAPSR